MNKQCSASPDELPDMKLVTKEQYKRWLSDSLTAAQRDRIVAFIRAVRDNAFNLEDACIDLLKSDALIDGLDDACNYYFERINGDSNEDDRGVAIDPRTGRPVTT